MAQRVRSSRPAVSIIVPVYNASEHLEACIASLRKQTFPDMEIICIDDASTDGSWEILQSLARCDNAIRAFNLRWNRGAGGARNVGISRARGDYVMFVDSDDLLPSTAVETLYMTAKRDQVPLVRGNIAGMTSNEGLGIPVPRKSGISFYDEQALWIPWYHVCYLISRKMLWPFGPRYPRLTSGEDPVFIARVLVKCRRISCVGDIVYLYRQKDAYIKTYQQVKDHIRHVGMVRRIFCSAGYSHCWHNGYAYFSFRELLRLIDAAALPYERYWRCRNQLIEAYPEYPELFLRHQMGVEP